MPAGGGQTTRNLRGAGANIKTADEDKERDGVDYRAAKVTRIYWNPTDNEVITPGSGGIPNRVIGMAWEAYDDNEAASVFVNRTSRTGIFAVPAGTPDGYLLVFSR